MNEHAPPVPVSETPCILVVDDEEALRQLVARLLTRAGCEVVEVESASQALEAMRRRSFDLVVTDKNLPDGNGLDILKYAKASFPGLDVVLITAYPDFTSAVAALSAGAYDYLLKPFGDVDDVVHTVRRALEKRRLARDNERLLQSLVEANEKIAAANQELEAKVADRTRRLEALSLTDDVTGLYNQRYLFQRLKEETSRAERYERPFAIILLDIDDFKRVNDTRGHLFGSRVLQRLGEVLTRAVRTSDASVRYGGDEFVVLLPETEEAGAVEVAERLRAAVEAADLGEPDAPCRVTVSVGVATLQSGDSVEQIVRAADKGAYAAKAAGKNRVVVDHRAK